MKIVAKTQNPLSSQDESTPKCCVAKSAAQSGTQLSGDLSGVRAIRPKCPK